MKDLEVIGMNHHAYFIPYQEGVVAVLENILKNKFDILRRQNPDFFHEKFETLLIDDSRRIKDLHSSKSFQEGNKRIFIIETKGITHEAQNSLLKIFEEPHEHTHFFIIMPSAHVLLPTLKSRLHIFEKEEGAEQEGEVFVQAKDFLKLSPKEKIAFVDDLAKKISDEKAEKSEAVEFLAALESVLYQKTDMHKVSESEKKAFAAIAKARDYMNDRSPSVKQLLEFVALSF